MKMIEYVSNGKVVRVPPPPLPVIKQLDTITLGTDIGAQARSIFALQTVNLAAVATEAKLNSISIGITNITNIPTINVFVFNANPVTSVGAGVFAANAKMLLDSGDEKKKIFEATGTAITKPNALVDGGTYYYRQYWTVTANRRFTLDPTGNLYIAAMTSGGSMPRYTGGGATSNIDILVDAEIYAP